MGTKYSSGLRGSVLTAFGTIVLIAGGAVYVSTAWATDTARVSLDPNDISLSTQFEFDTTDQQSTAFANELASDLIMELLAIDDIGDTADTGAPPHLYNGIVGITGSPEAGYIVFVGSDADLNDVRRTATANATPEVVELLTFTQSERSGQELIDAYEKAVQGDWKNGKPLSYSVGLNSSTQMIEVSVGDAATDADVSRLQQLSPAISVNRKGSPPERLSRTNSSSPHRGGLRMSHFSGELCTNGFSVKGKTTGTVYSLTAGHCGANGSAWYATNFVGNLAGKANFPARDMARLKNSSYQTWIETDGGDDYDERRIVSAANGTVSSKVCLSGAITKSKCNVEIISYSNTMCDSFGCTTGLVKGTRNGDHLVVKGDSGGPVYYRNPSNQRASARGTIVGGESWGTVVYWHAWTTISNHLNVDVYTLP